MTVLTKGFCFSAVTWYSPKITKSVQNITVHFELCGNGDAVGLLTSLSWRSLQCAIYENSDSIFMDVEASVHSTPSVASNEEQALCKSVHV